MQTSEQENRQKAILHNLKKKHFAPLSSLPPSQLGTEALGVRYPTLGLAHVHLEPVSPSTVACSSSTRGMVGRTSRGHGGLAPTCGGWLTALAGSGCLSTLLGCCGHSAFAGGGWPSALARGGFLSAPAGGRLTPVLLLARGSRGWSLGLRWVRWE